jgi:surface protein
MSREEENYVIKETSCIIKSNKDIEYKIKLSIYYNDNISINIYTTKLIPSKKFSLICTLDDLMKNRFFKLFDNADEVFRELEPKIQNSSIIEETNFIYLDIPIGLTIINDIILKIKQCEKNKDDIIEELKNEINNLKNEINQLKNKQETNINGEGKNLEKLTEKIKEEEELKLIFDNFDKYQNIIEIGINSNNNEQIKNIIGDYFNNDNSTLYFNKKKIDFNDKIILENNNNNNKIFIFCNKSKFIMMFYKCNNISYIKFIKVAEYVEYMNNMFDGCSKLTSIDISKFNTQNVKDMQNMFSGYS